MLSPLYNEECNQKWRQYPAPDNGSYSYPWIWVDGRQCGWEYPYWGGSITSELTQPAPVEINLAGSYDPGLRSGRIQAEFVNSSGSSISAAALIAITEDSIYYVGTNGDYWHNHVGRDYVPDQNGTGVTIPPFGRDTVTRSFALDTNWNEERCNVVVYLQTPAVQPDSSKPVYQGAIAPVHQPSGISEHTGQMTSRTAPSATVVGRTLFLGGHRSAALLNSTGRKVTDLPPGVNDISRFPAGTYFVRQCGASLTVKPKVILY
jgi:hypothetical protein